ncbi:zinc finger CCCH domain-containing protein 13-like isoform X7 [Actinia tenebrosa]|uniref:Zinc finger CCCH domain-containing protein 13-like isoform X7 n=1 Tax=Actinia tenebrosa TaxID=6105 RepID=A0A6P8J5W6_ACTTE|nr:zinc finger CCCH domain-containing protein 13-like isoform X7 [Actinia tenebrosa]
MGDDDAAARREARRREREARRKEREAESTADDESARSRRRRKEEQQQEEEVKAERQRQEREREEAEAREKEERERERERRRREEQEAEERSRRRQEEEENDRRRRQKADAERSYNSRRGYHRDEENDDEEEEKEDTIFETMSPQKKASILEGLAEEFRRIVEQREAKGQMVAVSAQELDELDLKVRSLRTQVRKAEENNNQLNKQKREIDEKLKKNENELNKLRNELQTAEAENELAIKEGKKVAPKLPTGPAKKKASPFGGGFINVVRKAQSAAWEEKFKAMKDKKKGSEPKPDWVTKVKKPENPLIAIKKPAPSAAKPEEKKPQWAQTKLKKGGGGRDDAGTKFEKRPDWSARSLKKTEKKDEDDDDRVTKRHDWREGLKASDKK